MLNWLAPSFCPAKLEPAQAPADTCGSDLPKSWQSSQREATDPDAERCPPASVPVAWMEPQGSS